MNGSFTLSASAAGGIASLEAAGIDRRTALEAALQATMTLLVGPPCPLAADILQSAPLRGEGEDLSSLFTDLLDDLSDQLAYFGDGWQDISLSAVTRRDDGGLVAWGYVSGVPRGEYTTPAIRLHGEPTVDEIAPRRVVIRAALLREQTD